MFHHKLPIDFRRDRDFTLENTLSDLSKISRLFHTKWVQEEPDLGYELDKSSITGDVSTNNMGLLLPITLLFIPFTDLWVSSL